MTVRLLHWVWMTVFLLMTVTLLPFNLQAQSKDPTVKEGKEVPVHPLLVNGNPRQRGETPSGWRERVKDDAKGEVRCRAGPDVKALRWAPSRAIDPSEIASMFKPPGKIP